MGPRCRRFESFRPDQKIQTVAFAAVLIFWVARSDSNDKRSFVGGRIFHSIYHKYVINLRVSSYLCELRWACSYILGFPRLMPVGILVVIRTALTLVLIYSDSPRLKYAAWAENAGFYIQKCTVCDFIIAKYPQFSDITYTGKFRTVNGANNYLLKNTFSWSVKFSYLSAIRKSPCMFVWLCSSPFRALFIIFGDK